MAKIDIPKVQSNSFASKKQQSDEGLKKRGKAEKNTPREKLKPIVGDDAIVSTKKSVSRKLVSAFVKKDVVDVKDYLIFDVLIPNGKRFVLDFIAMTFFGERFDGRGRGYGYDSGRHDYTSHYRSSSRSQSSGRYERASSVDYRNIILRNRRDAEEIIDRLCDRIRDNGDVSVAELLDLLDMPSEYTDNNIGWKDPRDIGIRVVNSGFLLDVAEARYLN